MAQTNVNIRMDEETKIAFDKFCAEIGLSVSSAFNIFAKTVVREHRIPFELTTDTPNSVTAAAVNEVLGDAREDAAGADSDDSAADADAAEGDPENKEDLYSISTGSYYESPDYCGDESDYYEIGIETTSYRGTLAEAKKIAKKLRDKRSAENDNRFQSVYSWVTDSKGRRV